MSKIIDERVVSMQFDNRQFESNVKTTMSTLEKLKQSLNLSGASKGLEGVSAAASKCDISPLGTALESVKVKFSALEVMAVTALSNITNSAVNAGKRIVSSLTIDPIKTGFNEYETKINAIQTIMSNTASKGTTMDDITRVIGELNTYADKTIYNFAEMTRNIGTFTAAGVGLEESATAIQGIANLAAMSGSNSQQASTAMYQLSQAMASGTVKLMDWNSVVNAGMGGELFQNALKETAKAHGVAVDDIIKNYGSFRESLTEGWITTDVLTETLAKMTKSGAAEYLSQLTGVEQSQIEATQKLVAESKDGTATYEQLAEQLAATGKVSKEQALDMLKMADNAEDAATKVKTFTQLWDTLKESAQSGWSQTWETVVGDFEEAKEFLTELSDLFGGIISASADRRNKLLTSALGDRTVGLSDDELQRLEQQAQKTGKSLDELLEDKGVRNGRELLLDSLLNTIEAIRSVIKPVVEAFREIFPPTTAEQLYDILKGLEGFTSKLQLSKTASDNLKHTFKGLFSILDIGKEILFAVFNAVKPLFGGLDDLGGGILGITTSWGNWLISLRDTVRETNVFGLAADKVASVLKKLVDGIKTFFGFLKKKVVSPGWEGFLELLSGVWDFITKIGSKIAEVGSSIASAFRDAFRSGDIEAGIGILNAGLVTSILLGFRKLLGGGLGDVIEALSHPLETLSDKLSPVKSILDELKGCLESYQQDMKANVLLKIAGAIAILAVAILLIASIDSEKLSSSLAAITILFVDLIAAMAVFNKIDGKFRGAMKASILMISMSAAVLILSAAMKNIAELSWEEIGKGLAGVITLTAVLVAAAKVMSSGSKKVIKGAVQMVIMAAALKILVSVCRDLSTFKWEELGKGVAGIAGLLMTFVGFQALMKLIKPEKLMSSALSLVVIGAAMEIFAHVCKKFADQEWGDMAKAGAAIGGILILAAGFALLSGLSKKMIASSVALVIIGASMEIFADVCAKFGTMEWEELLKAGAAVGGLLVLAAGFALLSGLSKNLLRSVSSLVVIAAAMEIFADVCKKFGSLEWEELLKAGAAVGGLLVLAAGFALLAGLSSNMIASSASLLIMAGALSVLTPVLTTLGNMTWGGIIKGLVTIALAFTILGAAGLVLGPVVPVILALSAAIVLFGVGCALVGAGVLTLSIALTTLGASLAVIAVSIVETLVTIARGLGEIIVAACGSIASSAPALAIAFVEVIKAACYAIRESVPEIVETLFSLLVQILSTLRTYIPQLVTILADILIDLMDSLSIKMPEIVNSAVNLIAQFFVGLNKALGQGALGDLIKSLESVSLIFIALGVTAKIISTIPITAALTGVASLAIVIGGIAAILAALGGLAQIPGFDWIIGEGGRVLGQIGTALGTFIGNIVGGIASGISAVLPEIGANLSAFMANAMPFITGIKMVDGSMLESVGALTASILLLTAADFISGITSFIQGGSSFASLGAELSAFAVNALPFFMIAKTIDPLAMEGVKSIADMILTLTKADVLEGLTSWFTGGSSLTSFGTELAAFGPNLRAFADSVAGIDGESVKAAADAGKTLAEMCATIPNEGGVVGWFAGENSIAAFSDQLPGFAAGLKGFADNVAGLDAASVDAAVTAAKKIVDMTSTIPNEGGVVGWFMGENSISAFASQLPDFGTNLKSFADNVAGLDAASVESAVIAARKLVDMTNTIPNEGGVVGWFSGDNSLSFFASQLPGFGSYLAEFSANVAGLSVENITNAVNATAKIVDLANTLPDNKLFVNETTLSDFGSQLKKFGEKLSDFSGEIRGVSAANMSGIITQLNRLGTLAEKADSIKSLGDSLKTVADESLDKFVDAFDNAEAKVTKVGKNLIENLVNGIKATKDKPVNIIKVIMAKMVDTTRPYYTKFSSAGGSLVQGFAAGIKNSSYLAENAAVSVAKAALNAAKEALGINSPSKVFIGVGKSIPEGFAMGVGMLGNVIDDSVVSMASNALKGTKNMIAKLADYVETDIDSQPTIRPVLDLSDVASGAGQISSLFNMTPSVGVLSNLGSISSMMNRNQNGTNDDIISAIKDLGAALSTSGGDTYQINGITYDDDSSVAEAIRTITRAAKMERRV